MTLTQAYAVDGGRVPAAMLRRTLWASTGGATGVIGVGDLKVTALPTPGTSVNVAPGGAIMATRYAGASANETYAVVNDATVSVAIPATGSGGGRTDYIILKIDDWHFDGSQQAPADPKTALYCSLQRVSSITGLGYPFVVLAKITIPASTGTITNAMITDMRKVAQPRTKRYVKGVPLVANQKETLNSTTREYFPNPGKVTVDVPTWATNVKIRADWLMIGNPSTNCVGFIWVGWGDWTGTQFELETQKYSYNSPANSPDGARANYAVVDEMPVPAKYRGRSGITFQMWGSNHASTVGKPWVDEWSGAALDILFEEIADQA